MNAKKCSIVALVTVLSVALCIALLFLPAGRLSWVRGWLFVGLLLGPGAVLAVLLQRRDPELLRRRMRAGRETRGWDRVLVPLLKLGMCAEMLVGAFDAGPAESASLSLAYWPLGALAFLGGYALFTWAMLVNTHFESFVRIQTDRSHRVIDTGPYRYVRHPGYAGFTLQIVAVPLLLGSPLAFVPAIATLAVLVLRTALEDRLLQRQLAGYVDYGRRVRHRIIPGLW